MIQALLASNGVTFFAKYWRTIIFGFVLPGMFMSALFYLYKDNQNLRATNASMEFTNGLCELNYETLNKQYDELTLSVVEYEQQTKELEQEILDSQARIQTIQNEYRDRLVELGSDSIPKDCEGAAKWLKDIAGQLGK